MWFSRILSLLLTGPPEPLRLTGVPGEGAFRGRYLHIAGLPFALGRMIGQGDEAMVYELVSLRSGNCGHVVKICRYAPGTARYKRWAVSVRDELSPYAEVPDIERYPARLVEVPGGLVKAQRYITSNLATAWATPYPAVDVFRYLGQYGPEQAVGLANTLLDMHGPRGVLLQAKALSLRYADRTAEAAAVFEAAIEALTAERNASRFRATCQLATMLWEDYHSQPPPDDTLTIQLPGGYVHQQRFFATPEEAAADDSAQDRSALLLLEVLAEEPYLVCALASLTYMIADAPAAGPAVRATVAALERIDSEYDDLPQLRQLSEQFGDATAGGMDAGEPAGATSTPERPRLAGGLLTRFDRAYRPDPVRGQQARGRHLAAQSHLEAGRIDEAERELRSAVALDPGSIQYQISLVELLRESDRLEEARELAEAAAGKFSDDPAGYECLGHICVVRGEHHDGLLAFLRALRTEPQEPWRIEVKIGQTYKDLGEPGRALSFLRAAYEHAPEQPMAAVALAQVLRSSAKGATHDPAFEEALSILTAAAERTPDAATVLVSLAQSHAALHHAEETRALLQRAVDADPNHAFAREFLAAVEEWIASDRIE